MIGLSRVSFKRKLVTNFQDIEKLILLDLTYTMYDWIIIKIMSCKNII